MWLVYHCTHRRPRSLQFILSVTSQKGLGFWMASFAVENFNQVLVNYMSYGSDSISIISIFGFMLWVLKCMILNPLASISRYCRLTILNWPEDRDLYEHHQKANKNFTKLTAPSREQKLKVDIVEYMSYWLWSFILPTYKAKHTIIPCNNDTTCHHRKFA